MTTSVVVNPMKRFNANSATSSTMATAVTTEMQLHSGVNPKVDPIHCRIIPGHFILRCSRREIHFTWIPPKQPIKKALVKYKEHHATQFSTMSGHGWGGTDVRIRNHTLTGLKPNTVYEFGLNVIYENETFARFPSPTAIGDICACKTFADVPSLPKNLQYHYVQGNQYSLEWTPGTDNGEPILTYDLKAISLNDWTRNREKAKWHQLTPLNLTENHVNFTLDTDESTAIQLRAVNKVGRSQPSFLTLRPPLQKVTGDVRGSRSVFGSLNQMSSVVAYSLLSTGLLFFLLLVLMIYVYRRRRTNGKTTKHPFLISFNPSKRMHSGSGNDSFGLVGGASDLTTSGVPVDLSTLEPLWNQEVNSLYGMGKSDLISFEQVTQIPAANIRFHRYVGCGAFGKVWEGWLHVNDADGERFEKVALKVRNSKSLSEAEFRREATLMHRYQHANIVRFFGVSFDSPGQQCLVLEMMDQGNLRDYLHRARPRIAPNVAANMFAAAAICAAGSSGPIGDIRAAVGSDNSSSMNTGTTSTAAGAAVGGCGGMTAASSVITLTAQLDLPSLICIIRDIAHGCRYLEEQHFVHRDIAARNCLVSHNHPSGRIVKLCDFGLARDIYKDDCYRKRNEPKLPVRWMSPEAIRDGLFTTKSDVWAFSVTCWEVMTLGADPFYGRANLDVMNLVIGGHVLGRPENCPEEMYNQMLQCWSRFTEMRPSFADLAKKMNEFVQLAQNGDSPFSGPFLVTLPLPKSLPDSNGQPFFTCVPSENHLRHAIDGFQGSTQQRCQRRASFNEYRPGAPSAQSRLQQSLIIDRKTEGNQSLQPRRETLPARCEQENTIGYLVGVRTSEDPVLYNLGSYRDNREGHPSYLIPNAVGYDVSLSNSTIKHTTTATTTSAPQGLLIDQVTTDPMTSLNNDTRTGVNETTSFSNCTPTNRPNSLLESVTGPIPDNQQYETQPLSYHFLNQNSNVPYKPDSLDSVTRSLLLTNSNTMPANNADGTHTSGSTVGRSTMSYGFVETGGGLDSLGYQRPSWTSRGMSALFPQVPSLMQTGARNVNMLMPMDTMRCPGCKPKVSADTLSS